MKGTTRQADVTIGLDLGDIRCQACVLDAAGQVVERRSVATTKVAAYSDGIASLFRREVAGGRSVATLVAHAASGWRDGQGGADLALGVSFQFEAVGIVHEAVQDAVGGEGIRQLVQPGVHGQLTGNER